MRISKKALLITGISIVAISGCVNKNTVNVATPDAPSTVESVEKYIYNEETSKIYLTENGEDKQDITEYATGVSEGTLYLKTEGVAKVFGLNAKVLTQEEKDNFISKVKEEKLSDTGGEIIALSNADHELIFQEGNRMFVIDGKAAMLDGSCIANEYGTYSVPLTSLVFVFGYNSLGSSVQGDSITYTLIRN